MERKQECGTGGKQQWPQDPRGDRPDCREGSRQGEDEAGLGARWCRSAAHPPDPDTVPSASPASVSPLWHWNKGHAECRLRRPRHPDPAPGWLKATGRGRCLPTVNTERERQMGLLLMPGGRGRTTCGRDGLCRSPLSSRQGRRGGRLARKFQWPFLGEVVGLGTKEMV